MDAELKKDLDIAQSEIDTQAARIAEGKKHSNPDNEILRFNEASFLLGWEECRRWAISQGINWPHKL